MNIPDKVKIGGINYAISKEPRVNKSNVCVDGEIYYDQCEIILRSDMEQSQQYNEMVFVHECVHGILFSLGLDHDDEKFVDILGKGIHAFIKDNPQIFNQGEEDSQ